VEWAAERPGQNMNVCCSGFPNEAKWPLPSAEAFVHFCSPDRLILTFLNLLYGYSNV
jgi:hypothetical protein